MAPPETVRLDEQFYIVAEAERSAIPLRVMKQGDSFGVFDQYGDIVLAEHLTNPDILRDNRVAVARGEIHIFRSRVLSEGGFAECIRITNHALQTVRLPLTV